MNIFVETIKNVSNSFLKEAKQSPQLIEDIAKMEYYMAESYNGRLFIELLQNADDAKSTRIISFYNNGNLYFGNNGRPFSEQDLIAISRSGSSKKERGRAIGYRGIGFKSASYISDDIIIYSNNTYFTFSKERCAKLLNMKKENVPTIRIPLWINEVEEKIEKDIDFLKSNGYSTIFVFKNAEIEIFNEEIKDVDDGYFLFLNNICECTFWNDKSIKRSIQIDKFTDNGNQHMEIMDGIKKSEWMIIKNKDVSIAFLIEKGIIVPCGLNSAVYHCYLPTVEKSIIDCKINADFSTDPSRKHIVLDEKTKSSLDKVSNIFLSLFEMAIRDADTGKYRNIFNMYLNKNTFSKINTILEEKISNRVSNKKWIKLNNGINISPQEYKMMPSSFEISNFEKVRTVSGYLAENSLPLTTYENIDNVDEFLNLYSEKEFELNDFSNSLKDVEYVKGLNTESHIQLLTNVIRESKIKESLDTSYISNIKELLVRNQNKNIISMEKLIKNNEVLDNIIKNELSERLTSSEIAWVQNTTHSKDLISITEEQACSSVNTNKQSDIIKINPYISKWRDAEQKCIEIETFWGNTCEDVSMKNLGYDVYSITPLGEKRYIEVKSVKKDFSFSLTNNEYATAHEYGDKYYICLLLEEETRLEVRYIKNPLKHARFEKRIKQWEWMCIESESTKSIFELK